MPTQFKGLPAAIRYKLAPEMNAGKRACLLESHCEWKRVLPLAGALYLEPFLRGELLPDALRSSGPLQRFPETSMGASQRSLMARAIAGQAASWASNLANRLARCVLNTRLDDALRHQLLWINARRAWLLPYREQVALLETQPVDKRRLKTLTPSASRWMRKFVRRYLELHRLPNFAGLPMQVNATSSVLAPRTQTSSFWATRWLRMTTLVRGQRIELPVMANAFGDAIRGDIAETFTLVPEGDDWYLGIVKYRSPERWEEHHVERLAIDLGLTNLMATSEGEVIGTGFLRKLERYDRQLQQLQKGLQDAGQYRLAQCRRYRVLVARLQGYLKTTIQTALGKLLDRRRPKVVVIEDLLFAGEHGNLSRRLNRLLRRFGQRYFTETLKQREKLYGFELVKVDPAYTSQTCNRCGFIHSGNRSRNLFKCLACGHRSHADVNAAKNQLGRSVLEATRRPVSRSTRRARALDEWVTLLKRALVEAVPDSPRIYRVVGSAKAGLRALLERKDSARRLSASMRERLQACLLAATPVGLLDGLSVVGSFN